MELHAGYVPPTGAPDPRLVARLLGFTVLSIALHAITLVVPFPAGGGTAASGKDLPRALNAVLAPAPSSAIGAESAPRSSEAAAPEIASAGETNADTAAGDAAAAAVSAGAPLPLPDKWYTASELAVLAHPLTLPKLVYPRDLAGSPVAARVRIRLYVDEQGVVRKQEIVSGGPEAAFDIAATSAWEDVRFTPAIKDGVAVKSQKLLELEFVPN